MKGEQQRRNKNFMLENYDTQNDNTDLLKAILLVGAFALIAYLIVKNNE